MTTNPIKYVEVRIEQLKEEYSKNPSEENAMIFDKAVMELMPTEGEALIMMLTILVVGTVLLNRIVSLFI